MAPWTWALISVLFIGALALPESTDYTVDLSDTKISSSLTAFYNTVSPRNIKKLGLNSDGNPFVSDFVGYSLAGCIIIDNGADNGAIVIDTTDSVLVTQQILADFRTYSTSNIHAIIYTHMHADHVYGAHTFQATNLTMKVYAHKNWPIQATELAVTPVSRQAWLRANRVFALLLNDTQRGPVVAYRFNNTGGFAFPNAAIMNNTESHIIAGLNVTFYYAPGETQDMLGITVVDSLGKKYLFPGDDFYSTYPNVYAVRGIGRDIPTWIAAIDTLRATNADYLIPSHTNPIEGSENINGVLTRYRDAIKFVYDQTIRYMNQGLEPEECVKLIKLPASLANDPNLPDNYGMVEWVSKWAYETFAGWFGGHALDLKGFSRKQLAKRMAKLVKYANNKPTPDLAVCAKNAYNDADNGDDYQWAAMLADYAVLADDGSSDIPLAKKYRYLAMKKWAGKQESMNARFYIMTAILEQDGLLVNNPVPQQQGNLATNSHEVILKEFNTRIKAENTTCAAYVINGTLALTDTSTIVFGLQMRNGIVQYLVGGLPSGVTAGFTISATGANWRSVLINNYFTPQLSTSAAVLTSVSGSAEADKFYACFDAYATL